MRDARQERIIVESERGFSLIEVLISILITVIVMGAVFGLLTKGQRSFQREPELADLQQSARTALDLVAKDILQGGAGLPPEFPAFSRIWGGDANPTDRLEVIGTFQSAGNVWLEPEEVGSLDILGVVTLRSNMTNLEINDMVVLYNNVANVDTTGAGRVPQWALAQVTAFTENPLAPAVMATVTLNYAAYLPGYSKLNATPPVPGEFRWTAPQQMPKITRASVVRYFTQPDALGSSNPPPEVLMRNVDFAPLANSQAVGYLDDFEIRYVIGVTAPIEQDNPQDPTVDLAGIVLTSENMIASVRVSITGRSVTAGLEGATEGAMVGNRADDFIRKTFSTNVNPRNISAGIDIRTLTP